MDLQQILDFVLPKVQDGKEDEAKKLIEKQAGKASSNPLSGLKIGNFDLGNIDLSAVLPKLAAMIKPEYVQEVKDFLQKALTSAK